MTDRINYPPRPGEGAWRLSAYGATAVNAAVSVRSPSFSSMRPSVPTTMSSIAASLVSFRSDTFEEGVQADPLAVPHPDAAVASWVAEVLEHVVRRLAGLAPGAFHARARTRSTSSCRNVYIPVYV